MRNLAKIPRKFLKFEIRNLIKILQRFYFRFLIYFTPSSITPVVSASKIPDAYLVQLCEALESNLQQGIELSSYLI